MEHYSVKTLCVFLTKWSQLQFEICYDTIKRPCLYQSAFPTYNRPTSYGRGKCYFNGICSNRIGWKLKSFQWATTTDKKIPRTSLFATSVQTYSVSSETCICEENQYVPRTVAGSVWHKSGNVIFFTRPAICGVFTSWKTIFPVHLRNGAESKKCCLSLIFKIP